MSEKEKSAARLEFEKRADYLREQCKNRKLERMRHRSILELDPQVRRFCANVAEGHSPSDAAHMAGYNDPGKMATNLMRRSAVKRALNVMIERTMKHAEITRDDVIAGFQDAIAIARQQSEAMGMIAGWREIGKMLGMYEVKVKVEVVGGAAEIQRQLQGMSDAELLKMVHERSSLLPPIEGELAAEDAEFEEVPPDAQ